ncbi:MAG TPA: beta-mannanase, partial [Kocuria rosea]|nr:beta-mannanase [Kocuria rosea]
MPRSPRPLLSAAVVAGALLLAAPAAPALAAPLTAPATAKKAGKPTPTATPTPTPTATPTTSPQVRSCPLRFGVGTPGGAGASAELAEVASLTGEKPSMVLAYKD